MRTRWDKVYQIISIDAGRSFGVNKSSVTGIAGAKPYYLNPVQNMNMA